MEDTNILTIKSTIESWVLLTTEEATSWLLSSQCLLPCNSVVIPIPPTHHPILWSGLCWKLSTLSSYQHQHVRVQSPRRFHANSIQRATCLRTPWSKHPCLFLIQSMDSTLRNLQSKLVRADYFLLCLLYISLRESALFLVDLLVSLLWYGRVGHLSKSGSTYLSRSGYIPKLAISNH